MSDTPPAVPQQTVVQKTSEDVNSKKRIKFEAASSMAIFLQGKTGYDVDKYLNGVKRLAAYFNDDTL